MDFKNRMYIERAMWLRFLELKFSFYGTETKIGENPKKKADQFTSVNSITYPNNMYQQGIIKIHVSIQAFLYYH